jgi:hypothetical protein
MDTNKVEAGVVGFWEVVGVAVLSRWSENVSLSR